MKKRHIFINAFLVIGGILIDRFIRNIHITFRTIMNMLCKIFKSFDSMKQMQIDKVPGKITPNIKKYGKKAIFVNAFYVTWAILIHRFVRNIHITFRTIMNMLCEIFKSFDLMKQTQIDKVPGK